MLGELPTWAAFQPYLVQLQVGAALGWDARGTRAAMGTVSSACMHSQQPGRTSAAYVEISCLLHCTDGAGRGLAGTSSGSL